MNNIWTLMIFSDRSDQAIVLQYKTVAGAAMDRDKVLAGTDNTVLLVDDYGRQLSLRPSDVAMALLQDVDRAAEGNTASNVKNNVANAIAQVATQSEIEKNPEVKAAMTRAALTQGLAGRPSIIQ
jgi:hypothetical protein